jgi:hypothetical protein
MGAQRLRGSQGRLNFTGVIDRGGKWNQDAFDAHDLRAPAVPPFATTGGIMFADVVSDAALLGRLDRDVALYHAIDNVGIALEFLARNVRSYRMDMPDAERSIVGSSGTADLAATV